MDYLVKRKGCLNPLEIYLCINITYLILQWSHTPLCLRLNFVTMETNAADTLDFRLLEWEASLKWDWGTTLLLWQRVSFSNRCVRDGENGSSAMWRKWTNSRQREVVLQHLRYNSNSQDAKFRFIPPSDQLQNWSADVVGKSRHGNKQKSPSLDALMSKETICQNGPHKQHSPRGSYESDLWWKQTLAHHGISLSKLYAPLIPTKLWAPLKKAIRGGTFRIRRTGFYISPQMDQWSNWCLNIPFNSWSPSSYL